MSPDVAASIKARLLNQAKARREEFEADIRGIERDILRMLAEVTGVGWAK